MLDPEIESELESKSVAVNKANMKLHLAKVELREVVCNAICSMLPSDSDKDEIIKAAKTINAYNAFDLKEKKKIVDMVWQALN